MSQKPPPYELRIREFRCAVESLMDGDEPEALFVGRVRRAPRLDRSADFLDFAEHTAIKFHQPVRRPHRLMTVDGRTSFHFSHRTVVRLRAGSSFDGMLLRPGAARDHCRYVERESAVASITYNLTPSASSLIADGSNMPQAYVETDDDLRPYANHLAVANDGAVATDNAVANGRLYSADFCLAEARSATDGLCALPGFNVAGAGRQPDRLLHSDSGGGLERKNGDTDGGLRRSADSLGAVAQAPAGGNGGRSVRSIAAGHLSYIERDAAVVVEADGNAAIITNIAVFAEDRLKFWELVEEEEGKPGPDRMTIDLDRNPRFWERVIGDERCPAELRRALEAQEASDRQKFIISSGKDVRTFLATVPGWDGRRKRQENETAADYREAGRGLADFHDGRGGRVQYRIIGELPSELSMVGRMRALRRFAQRFEELRMPFNLAMHAPDHGNSEHQWHFHLDYYDRPSWRLTTEDVEAARAKGYRPVGNAVGEWSFAAKFRKNGKVSRPFREDKVEERRNPDWIERLRERLAFVINEELKREGQYPRYDPRRYDQIGIKAEPGEHLGTKLSAAEGKGDISERSIANEAKQWAAIQNQLKDQHEAGELMISGQTEARKQRLQSIDLASDERASLVNKIAELDALERSILDVDHEIATVQQLTARACSRASKIQQVNQRWLDADEAGECAMTPRLRRERVSLRSAASDYLGRLEPLRGAAADIISVCDSVRASDLANKRALERDIEARLAGAAAKAALLSAWLEQLDKQRPLIVATRDGYRLTAAQADKGLVSSDLAQQALKSRYARQEQDVDGLIAIVQKRRLSLERRAGRWMFHHSDPAVVARFDVLREHPRVSGAIERIISPPGDVDPPIQHFGSHHTVSKSSPAPVRRPSEPLPPSHGAAPVPSLGERPELPTLHKPPAPAQSPAPPVPIVAPPVPIVAPPLPSERQAAPAPKAVSISAPDRPSADAALPMTVASGPSSSTPAAGNASRSDMPSGPRVIGDNPLRREDRIGAMASALNGAKVVPKMAKPPAMAEKTPAIPASSAAPPGSTAAAPTNAATTSPASVPLLAAPGAFSVQRIIADKIVLRLGRDGQIDAQALARQGVSIADADRRDPRLIGKAREQKLYARKVVENFVTKYPGFIVLAGDGCLLSAKTKPDVRAFFENHNDPSMQVMLRRAFDQHKVAKASPVAMDAVASPTDVRPQPVVEPSSMTILQRDPAMIAAAQARLSDQARQQANTAARQEAAVKRSKIVAANNRDGRARSPTPPISEPRWPPPGWDDGFER